jgi:hypothetical protein
MRLSTGKARAAANASTAPRITLVVISSPAAGVRIFSSLVMRAVAMSEVNSLVVRAVTMSKVNSLVVRAVAMAEANSLVIMYNASASAAGRANTRWGPHTGDYEV